MRVKLGDYLIAKKGIKKFITEKPHMKLDDAIVQFCLFTGIPIIVACYYYLDIFGENEMVRSKIKSLTDFYGYTKIIGEHGEVYEC